jgi:2-keto-4-pentenoate hydratase/2-oxohepta-3-ene-1,7-dioic acid hydratase in catechol pathway
MSWIALASQRRGHTTAPAVVVGQQQLVDLGRAEAAGVPRPAAAWVEGGVAAMLADWPRASAWLREAAGPLTEAVAAGRVEATPAGGAVAAPFRPERIFCAASNFVEHANEMGTVLAEKASSKPYMFLKLRNAVIGDGEAIRMPPETKQLDWEIELGAVIGQRCRRIGVDRALEAIAGYTVVNDISARDLNVRSDYPFKFDWFQGKAHDTFAPLGPWIVPAWQVPDPQAVHLELKVNDRTMQEDTTANMIWTVREQIAYLSTIVTLEPGDVIATGTPTGVGMGRGVFLKRGDRIAATIRGIGTLSNTVEADTVG